MRQGLSDGGMPGFLLPKTGPQRSPQINEKCRKFEKNPLFSAFAQETMQKAAEISHVRGWPHFEA
jgi:hypothetical protein